MLPEFLVGLDVGTTGAKAVVYAADGSALAQRRVSLKWESTRHGAEISADAIVDASRRAINGALERSPEGTGAGIGITSFAESGILLDAAGEPVTSVIAWHDRRDSAELEQLRAEFGDEAFSTVTGLPFRQQWSITKQRWLTSNVPSASSAVLRLNPGEWVAYRLGARAATEASLASRTGWLRLRQRTWWDEALEWSGISADLLPPIVSAGERLGVVSREVGIERAIGAVITVAGQDHQSAATGLGGIALGDEVDSCGTADALLRTTAPIESDATILALAQAGVTVGWHAVPGAWCLLGATEGGLLLGRALAMLGYEDFTAGGLDRTAAGLAAASIRASVDSDGRLTLAAIGDEASPAQVWRAVVDLAVAQSRELHDRIAELVGPHRRLLLTGGWLKSETFAQGKAHSLGSVEQRTVEEAGARGAAAFAAVAAGLLDRVDQVERGAGLVNA